VLGWLDEEMPSEHGDLLQTRHLGVIHVGTEWWALKLFALRCGRLGEIPFGISKCHHDS